MDSRLTRNSTRKPLNVRVTKPSAMDQLYYKTVKDSGIDIDGMTRTEISDLAKVLLLSKSGSDTNKINQEEEEGSVTYIRNGIKDDKMESDNTDSEDGNSQQIYIPNEPTLREDVDPDNSSQQKYIPYDSTLREDIDTKNSSQEKYIADESTLREDIDSHESLHHGNQVMNAHGCLVTSPRFSVEHIIHGSSSDDDETQAYDADIQKYAERQSSHRVSMKQKLKLSKHVPKNETVSRQSVEETDNEEVDTICETQTDEQSHEKEDINSQKLPENTECTSDEELFSTPVKELIRQYRRKRSTACSGVNVYSSSINSPETCAKVIEQLFEIYHRKVTLAQAKVQRYLPWPEPVKVGKHWNKTIDVKKRGAFIPLEDSDEDLDDTKQSERDKKRIIDKKEENDMETDQSLAVKRKYPKLRKIRKCVPTDNTTKHTNEVGKYIPDFEEGNNNTEMMEELKTSKEIPGDSNTGLGHLDSGPEECADDKSRNRVAKIDVTSENNAKSNLSGKIHRQRFRLEDDSEEEEKQSPDLRPSENSSQKESENSSQQKQSASACKTDSDTGKKDVGQKKLRKLYTSSDVKFLPTTKAMQRHENDPQLGAASSEVDKSKTESFNALRQTRTRNTFKRNYSDLSTASTESGQSEEEFIKHLNGQQRQEASSPERPCSRGSESSIDRLSQSSNLMFDPQGELYSTQFCVLKEKSGSKGVDQEPKVNRGSGRNIPKQQDDSNIFQKITKNLGNRSLRSTRSSPCKIPKGPVETTVIELDESSSDGEDFLTLKKTKVGVKFLPEPEPKQDESTDDEVSFRKMGKRDNGVPNVSRSENSQQVLLETEGRHRIEGKTASIDEDSKDGWLTATGPRAGSSKQIIKTYSRIGKKRPIQEAETTHKKMKLEPAEGPSEMSCPLCFGKFRLDEIEAHAADCDGSTADYVANKEENPSRNVNSNRKTDDEQERDANVPYSEADISRDMESCYVCDQSFPKGLRYEDHVNKCLQEATKLQKAADSKGYSILIEDENMETTRTTRSKIKPTNSKLHRGLEEAWSEIDG